MSRSLSPIQCMIVNAAWIVGFVFLVLFLARDGDPGSHNIPILNVLLLLGPILSASLCDRLSGPILGAVGFAVGTVLAGALCALAVPSVPIAWGRAVFIPLVSIGQLAITIPVWWLFHRCRRATGATASPQ